MATTNMGRTTRGVWAKRLAAAVAIAALGLTACSNDEEPEKPAVETTAESNEKAASDSGGDDASDGGEAGGFAMPPENEGLLPPDRANYPGIDSETDEGAEQTVRFFIDAVYYGNATGDTAPIESVSASNCTLCLKAIDDIDTQTGIEGSFLVGYAVEPQMLTVAPPNQPGLTSIYYAYREGDASRHSSDGRIDSYAGRAMHSAANLRLKDGRWEVVTIVWEEDSDV
ncbi:MAG: DUF6318 family protein [Dermabacter sp.]|nr:DUF6318 family protein [Dermabacter sp.]